MRLPWAVLLLALLTGRYLHWRITATLNLTTPLAGTLSLLLLAAELWLQAHGLLLLLFTLAPERARPADAPAQRQQGPSSAAVPWVDVLVPSYGEPLEVVERCLRGCRAIAYPAFAVWLLDDSGRPELQALCERLAAATASASGASTPRPAISTTCCRS
ncbi:glycosyltransferase [Synechococcus sp. GFB01]|uniref:glycosyltransferase n=1 Tax=Synechococcus sp. GFB01 TaxID=1662190 RepID=UPI00069E6C9F|nr:glycosyltransferase [Synechococcus sp. GFB01]